MLSLVVGIVIVLVAVAIIYYALQTFPPPEPLGKFIRFGIVVVALIVVCVLLLNAIGYNTGISLR
jgi:uncharacterized membrane protein YwzB